MIDRVLYKSYLLKVSRDKSNVVKKIECACILRHVLSLRLPKNLTIIAGVPGITQ